jgi:hypothetical protein
MLTLQQNLNFEYIETLDLEDQYICYCEIVESQNQTNFYLSPNNPTDKDGKFLKYKPIYITK